MKAFYQDFRLGIVGGGQLGRMLLQPCTAFNILSIVLDPAGDAPCSQLATEFHQGSLQDRDAVLAFGRQCDLITIEIENVNTQALHELEQEGIPVYPQPRVIEIIQDKRRQKQFYRDHGIPSADYVLVANRAEVESRADFLPAFHKLGVGGYDGGGVRRLNGQADIGLAFDEPGLLEKLVEVEREISVIAARNPQGEIAVYPPVECVFHPEHNLVDYLLAPASLDQAILATAVELARNVVEKLEIVGLLAVEMFVTPEGEVLVNESAPRPHNSGHQTINANDTSQYEQHLRAILGLPLGSTAIIKPSAMVNLLGEEGYTGVPRYEGLEEVLKIQGVNVILYGKKVTRPHRKMGHITVLDDDIEVLKKKMDYIRKMVRVVA